MNTLLKTIGMVLFAVTLVTTSAQALEIKVFTGDGPGFLATSTLISGDQDAVLIDAQFTLSEAHKLTAMILESGKSLSRIYITHAHPDHYFGAEVLLQQFPNAKLLAHPKVVEQMRVSAPKDLAEWKPRYGNDLTSAPVLAEPYNEETFAIEGQSIRILELLHGEIEFTTAYFIEESKTLIAGDVVYDGVHVWLAEADNDRKEQWLRNLEQLRKLNPKIVVPGHRTLESNLSPSSIDFTANYIEKFMALVKSGYSKDLVKEKMLELYPLALPIILDISLEAEFSGNHGH